MGDRNHVPRIHWVTMFAKTSALTDLDYQFTLIGAQEHLISDLAADSAQHVVVAAGATLLDTTLTANAQSVVVFTFTNTAPGRVVITQADANPK